MGIRRQDMEFWNYIARKDYICLNETDYICLNDMDRREGMEQDKEKSARHA